VVLAALKSASREQSLYSQSWYRVAGLKPRLRGHIQVHRQFFRDREWFVLQDRSTGRFHRISPEAYYLVGLMDGGRTMTEIWDAACVQLGEAVPTQEEVIALLSQIHRFDGLQSDLPPDIADLSERRGSEKRSKLLGYIASPTSFKIPLFDPDRFLDATIGFVRPLMGWAGFLAWVAVVGYGLLLAGIHWRELTSNVTDRMLSVENLVVLSLVFPLVKLLHETGHAYAVKRGGGEVHEMGIMLLVFVPNPYVDATASYAFRSRYARMFVGAAGIMVELFLAGLAAIVWTSVEPGALRSVAFNTMVIGGVSTLLMNGNPLIRYDAYYILSDFLEIPNLGARSSEYLGYLFKRRILGIREAVSTAAGPGEAAILAIYGIASFAYRLSIMAAITLAIAGRFFVVGILLAAWTVVGFVGIPLWRALRTMSSDSLMRRYRVRTVAAVAVAASLAFYVVGMVRIPSFTVVEGVTWVPEESQINATADGIVTEVIAASDSDVRKGDPLIRFESPKLDKEVRVLEGAVKEAEARYQVSLVSDRAAMNNLRDDLAKARLELTRARERLGGLLARSPAEGRLLLISPKDLPGRFVHKGDGLGYVVDFPKAVLRIVVDQDDVERIRHASTKVEARLAGNMERVLPATVVREVPAASNDLPSAALGVGGGGSIAVSPDSGGGRKPKTIRKYFGFEVRLEGTPVARIGERAFLRFTHPPETLGERWHRGLRRLFLRKFDL
jgi:putative peptide zinc metalloprotease protein